MLSRRFGNVPTDIVAGYCLITALVALLAAPRAGGDRVAGDARQWIAVILLGLFPLGAGFYAWDYGCKHGDIMVLGGAVLRRAAVLGDRAPAGRLRQPFQLVRRGRLFFSSPRER